MSQPGRRSAERAGRPQVPPQQVQIAAIGHTVKISVGTTHRQPPRQTRLNGEHGALTQATLLNEGRMSIMTNLNQKRRAPLHNCCQLMAPIEWTVTATRTVDVWSGPCSLVGSPGTDEATCRRMDRSTLARPLLQPLTVATISST